LRHVTAKCPQTAAAVSALSIFVGLVMLFLNEWTLATKLAEFFSGVTCGSSLAGAFASAPQQPVRS
jgi:hypothetical protein